MISAELKVVGGKHSGQVIPLNRKKFLIGREQDCQLRPNSEMVSRHHCVFSLDDYSVRLRDLGSTNGTLVNGERIQREVVLASADRIVIGNLDFELVIRADVQAPDVDSRVFPTAVLASDETQVSAPTVTEAPAVSGAAIPSDQTISMPIPVAASSADTTVMSMPQMMPGMAGMPGMPGQYPFQPMMPQMGGYPGGMYGGFPYQPPMMPGYGQMYPQMMPQMGYPMGGGMMPPGMPVPGMAPPAPAAAAPEGGDVGKLEVSLPDPSTTGAREGEPSKGSAGATPKDSTKPTGAADAIIKQYLGRR